MDLACTIGRVFGNKGKRNKRRFDLFGNMSEVFVWFNARLLGLDVMLLLLL